MTDKTSKGQAALLVIDVQLELFQKSTPIYQAELFLRNINALIKLARLSDVPVIFIQHSSEKYLVKGSEGWQLHPALQPAVEDLVIHKRHPNAFEDTNLRDELEKRNVSTLVIAGLVTHGCVKATCLGALEEGYKVKLAGDAHSSYSKDAPQLIEKWNEELSRKGVEVIKSKDVSFLQPVFLANDGEDEVNHQNYYGQLKGEESRDSKC